jgi:hypothetical protein
LLAENYYILEHLMGSETFENLIDDDAGVFHGNIYKLSPTDSSYLLTVV